MEYVRQFRQKFVALFPKRRELFLAPQNEFGCSKFVCTTVRPTLLPFDQLYEAEPLAKFVANFLQYEPLEAPDAFPVYSRLQHKLWTGSAATASTSRYSYVVGSRVTGTTRTWSVATRPPTSR